MKRSFPLKYFEFKFLTRSIALCFELRYAQHFLAKMNRPTHWSLYPQGLTIPGKVTNLLASAMGSNFDAIFFEI
jgi:hypothetical protein